MVLAFLLAIFVADRLYPPDLHRLASLGREIDDRDGRLLTLLPARDGVWRLRTTPRDVDPHFLALLIQVEDRHFRDHPGVDPLALLRAASQWVRAGHVVSGGSTLTMQTVRLLEPRPRTLRSKAIEILRALQLEAHYSRDDILSFWLTLAPYGGNLEGVRAASLAWFGHEPNALEPEEAALLVAIPRRPEALRPDRFPTRAMALRDRILGGTHEDVPVPSHRLPMPRHAAQLLAALPPLASQRSTLDLPTQLQIERLASARLRDLPERASLAILVADLRSRTILAAYPGEDGNQRRAGALDLTRAIRSPGSALKPFIYALAFQDGITSPDAPVADLPHRFGDYAPEDFDRHFAGVITAGEALRRSLNVPAVALLDRIGPLRYMAQLRAAGITLRLPRGADPALPLALGGAGITLRDAAALYAGLATDGRVAPLRLTPGDVPTPVPFVEPGAARLTADVLTQRLPGRLLGGIAWKTGTSWGGRDAWALGFDRERVVGVWVGRPDGTALPGATGRDYALPVLGDVFDLLPPAPRTVASEPVAALPDAPAAEATLRLLFPPSGAALSQGPVTIRVMGGQRPLTFLVDGERIDAEPFRREAAWTPPSPGFYRLTVLDQSGESVHATVRVEAK